MSRLSSIVRDLRAARHAAEQGFQNSGEDDVSADWFRDSLKSLADAIETLAAGLEDSHD